MDNLANHTEDTVKADLKKKRDQDAAPAAPAADSNPFSGMLNKLMGGDMMGRIMGVLSGLLNMIVGFFENMLSGPKHGVSNNNFGLSRDAGATPPGPASAPSSAAPGAVRQPQTAPGG
jgi:predicted lipid-binding transport protein (Tim44 family)